MEYAKIIGFCIVAACVYGIAHDMVTAHVCVEYFMPPIHPMIVTTNSPLLLALIWGVIATWWVGLFLGIMLAVVCRIGQRPKLTVNDIVRPTLFLLTFLYIISMLFGVVGYIAGQMRWVWLLPPISQAVAAERHALVLFDLWAHGAAYIFVVIGGIVLMIFAWKKRQSASCPC